MRELTISEAARRCGVHRRTLQRAIQRGRLHLTPAAHLTLDALQQAGYTAAAPHATPPHVLRQEHASHAHAGGTIYAMQAVGTPWVKIGSTSASVAQRLKRLQTGQPFPLEVIATVPVSSDLQRIERQVHAFLAEVQRRGEWFEMALDTQALEQLIVRAVQHIKQDDEQRQRARLSKTQRTSAALVVSQEFIDALQHLLERLDDVVVCLAERLDVLSTPCRARHLSPEEDN